MKTWAWIQAGALTICAVLIGMGCALTEPTAKAEETIPEPPCQVVMETPHEVKTELRPTEEEVAAAVVLAKMVWGEANTCTTTEQAGAIWCALNRVDDPDFPDDIVSVVTAPKQFHGYRAANPVDEEIFNLVWDVLDRWEAEKQGETDVGRVLPADYCWFLGDGHKHNYFTNAWRGGDVWDWTLPSPYEN